MGSSEKVLAQVLLPPPPIPPGPWGASLPPEGLGGLGGGGGGVSPETGALHIGHFVPSAVLRYPLRHSERWCMINKLVTD